VGIWKEAVVVHLKNNDLRWITRGSRNLDMVPFRTIGRIRASVVTKEMNISQLRFPTCQIPQKTGCQGGQGSPRAVAPSEEEEEEKYAYLCVTN
jgi:hypothetical protein